MALGTPFTVSLVIPREATETPREEAKGAAALTGTELSLFENVEDAEDEVEGFVDEIEDKSEVNAGFDAAPALVIDVCRFVASVARVAGDAPDILAERNADIAGATDVGIVKPSVITSVCPLMTRFKEDVFKAAVCKRRLVKPPGT